MNYVSLLSEYELCLCNINSCATRRAFLESQMSKDLNAMKETWVQSLGQQDPLRKKWLPIPVFLPGKSLGQRSLKGPSPWDRKESDLTERLFFTGGCKSKIKL